MCGVSQEHACRREASRGQDPGSLERTARQPPPPNDMRMDIDKPWHRQAAPSFGVLASCQMGTPILSEPIKEDVAQRHSTTGTTSVPVETSAMRSIWTWPDVTTVEINPREGAAAPAPVGQRPESALHPAVSDRDGDWGHVHRITRRGATRMSDQLSSRRTSHPSRRPRPVEERGWVDEDGDSGADELPNQGAPTSWSGAENLSSLDISAPSRKPGSYPAGRADVALVDQGRGAHSVGRRCFPETSWRTA